MTWLHTVRIKIDEKMEYSADFYARTNADGIMMLGYIYFEHTAFLIKSEVFE